MMTAAISGSGSKGKPAKRNQPTDVMVRSRRALWLVLSMLALALLLVALGSYTTTRTETVSASGHISGFILTLGSFLGLLGLGLEENRRHLITAATVFLSLGVVASSLCLMIDGASTALNMDMRPLRAGRCQYYSGGDGYLYESYYTTVSCRTLEETCNMTVKSGTCYCCDLYRCANGAYMDSFYEFVGAQSCQDVLTLYVLMWGLSGLNLVAVFLSILTAAVLGSIRTTRCPGPGTREASSPSAPLLSNARDITAAPLHPAAPLYSPFPALASTSTALTQQLAVSQSFPVTPPGADLQTFPFAPLPHRA